MMTEEQVAALEEEALEALEAIQHSPANTPLLRYMPLVDAHIAADAKFRIARNRLKYGY